MKTKSTLKDRQEACDAGIVLTGMTVNVNGTQVLVDEINGNEYWGTDCDGADIGFTYEQIISITDLG
ncbi:MAG: hypothetical protein ACO3LB_08235 [Flavobacteriaceae bacterium]